ncbi:ABC transporter permease [Gelria sp. Kuro-4]|uniref:ABC transporter permease n=1 Tax=Gelria sp. Kuro-4 TaxID=2796927 RepID=UPI001BF12A29|nr:ABC transporter permease [Gelria sp. Kuro-4]MDK2927683.1 osmoprotectant transport system permease protein [Bacillota bacterium]BCV24450.1 glycine betaine/carnitine/choline transport system permease protein OpuCB [Gelria sp. Kuro-4]
MTWIKMWQYLVDNLPEVLLAIQEHVLLLVVFPVAVAVLIAVPLGIAATRWAWLERIVLSVVNVIQTIPSLAMMALFIPLGLGIGNKPAIVALLLYSLLPILRNTYTGIKGVDADLKEAATGMGMTELQRLIRVELPLSVPVIMAGVRTAAVIAIGTATLAAMVGGGGLGRYIYRGLQLMRDYLILVGAVPAAALALVADFILGRLEHWVTPEGLRLSRKKYE